MRERLQLSADLLALAARHGNVVDLSELRGAGVGDSPLQRMRGTELQPLGAGWFAIGTPTWHGYLHAALAIGGRQAVACRATALALDGLGPRSMPIQILAPTQLRSRDWVRFVRGELRFRDVKRAKEPPRTGPETSILDQVNTLDGADAIALVTLALQQQRTTPQRLLDGLRRRSRQRHRQLMEDLLRDACGLHSVLEHAYAVRVERPHRLPHAVRQYVVPETGHHSDLAYPETRHLIELDGVEFHDPQADQQLDNLHAAYGYSTQRYGWFTVTSAPCQTADLVATTIGADPNDHRCRRCAPR